MISAQADWILECRVKVQGGIVHGYWPSFWTTTIFWPDKGEVDIVEIIKNPVTGVTRSKFVLHGPSSTGGHTFTEVVEPVVPDDRWIHFAAKKVGGTISLYDDIDTEGTLVQRVTTSDSIIADVGGAHDIRMDLAVSSWWDGSGGINLEHYPAKVEFDWWRAWVPDDAAHDNAPLNILPVIETTPGGLWDTTLPTTATLFGADPGLEQAHGAMDNFDAPGQPDGQGDPNFPMPGGMSFDPATRAVTGTVPTNNGGASALMLTYAYDDGSPAGRVLQPYHVAPAVQDLPASWNVPTGNPVNIVIDFLDFHSGNLGPHTYDVTAPGLTVTGNGTPEVTVTGTAPASDVTLTIECTNTVGQTTTVPRNIMVS